MSKIEFVKWVHAYGHEVAEDVAEFRGASRTQVALWEAQYPCGTAGLPAVRSLMMEVSHVR